GPGPGPGRAAPAGAFEGGRALRKAPGRRTHPTAPHERIANVSKGKTTRRSRRLNRRALIILGTAARVVVPGLVRLEVVRERVGGRTYLNEARRLLAQKKPTNLVLGHLNRYLELNPDDFDALELKGRVLSDAAATESQAQEAAQVLGLVLGRAPK